MRRLVLAGIAFFLLSLMLSLTACQREAPDTRPADEAAIRTATAEWLRAVQAKDADSTASFYAADGSMFPAGAPIAKGKEAIRKAWADLFAIPGFNLSWQITGLEVARAGDLAYAHGTYEANWQDAKGNAISERGKWVDVWKKQADATWKAVADIYNADSPPPAQK